MESRDQLGYEWHRSVVISLRRATVLADLFDDARDHFGDSRVSVSGVRVAAVPGSTAVLATAFFNHWTSNPPPTS